MRGARHHHNLLLRRQTALILPIQTIPMPHSKPGTKPNAMRGCKTRLDGYYTKIGPLGARFRDDIQHAQRGESVDTTLNAHAAFNAHHLTEGFANTICYSEDALQSEKDLFSSRTHEGVHAMQFARSAASHATPFNGKTKIILCPRHGVLLDELKERDAFAKQWLFERLSDEDGYNAAAPETYARDLQDYAEKSLETIPWLRGKTLLDYYRNREIEAYEGCMTRRYQREQGFIFVRLSADDLWVIGGALGVNSFGDSPAQAARWEHLHPLTAAQEKRVAALNNKFGITDEAALPTLRQALLQQGLSPSQFLHQATSPAQISAKPANTPAGPRLVPNLP
jgi:hypothetical protein